MLRFYTLSDCDLGLVGMDLRAGRRGGRLPRPAAGSALRRNAARTRRFYGDTRAIVGKPSGEGGQSEAKRASSPQSSPPVLIGRYRLTQSLRLIGTEHPVWFCFCGQMASL